MTAKSYVHIGVGKSWQQAESYCINEYGTHLASVHSTEEEDELSSLVLNYGEPVGGGGWIRGYIPP